MAEPGKGVHYDADDLGDYFAGEMSDEEAEQLECHLADCPECGADAGLISARSQLWMSLLAEPSVVLPAVTAAAPVLSFPSPRPSSFWRFVVPAAAVFAAAALALVVILHQNLQRKFEQQQQLLTRMSKERDASQQQVRGLQQLVLQAQDQLAAALNSRGKPVPVPGPVRPEVIPASAVVLPVAVPSRALGPGRATVQELSFSTPVPPVTLQVNLPEIRPGAVLDAQLVSGDITIERRAIAVDRGSQPVRAAVELSAAEVKSLLNRQTQLTLTERGQSAVVNVYLILRPL